MFEAENIIGIVVADKDGVIKSVSRTNGGLPSGLIGAKWYDAFAIPVEKTDKLNDTEFAAIKSHPCQGEQIIKPLTFLDDAIHHIRGHHESFDGRGYPDRLGGEDLPLLTRIMTVADAFDAMTSDRTYRSSMKTNKAVSELRRVAGKQFDPEVVDAFASSEIVKMKSDLESNY